MNPVKYRPKYGREYATAYRDNAGYLIKCAKHDKLTCDQCAALGKGAWVRAWPGRYLDQTTVMEDAATLEGCRIYGDYGDWGVIGHLRDLWLRDLRTVLMASGESERLEKLFELLDETKGKR